MKWREPIDVTTADWGTIRRNAERHNNAAWFLATCPDPQFRNPARALEHAETACALIPVDANIWNTLGVAHYRNGQRQRALEALTRATDLPGGKNSFNSFFLAMTHWQLGQKDQAREWYDRAVEWQKKNRPWDPELLRFRAEAAALLGVKDQLPDR